MSTTELMALVRCKHARMAELEETLAECYAQLKERNPLQVGETYAENHDSRERVKGVEFKATDTYLADRHAERAEESGGVAMFYAAEGFERVDGSVHKLVHLMPIPTRGTVTIEEPGNNGK